jgi:hypothetical protein
MKKRYSIVVREYGSDHNVELMQVDSNPQAVVAGLHKKTLTIRKSILDPGKRATKIPKYTFVGIVENDV